MPGKLQMINEPHHGKILQVIPFRPLFKIFFLFKFLPSDLKFQQTKN